MSYIIPAAASLPDDLARRLSAHVANGGRLIFESAAGFGGFEAQRAMLAKHFDLIVNPPVDLWAASRPIPYIDYHWPFRVKVRDFSRVVPVSAPPSEIIGSIGPLPVAVRRGTLIFLGSPIGPALLAGDREAHSWFHALMQSAIR